MMKISPQISIAGIMVATTIPYFALDLAPVVFRALANGGLYLSNQSFRALSATWEFGVNQGPLIKSGVALPFRALSATWEFGVSQGPFIQKGLSFLADKALSAGSYAQESLAVDTPFYWGDHPLTYGEATLALSATASIASLFRACWNKRKTYFFASSFK